LILKCDDALSNVAFNFNLRRYTEVTWDDVGSLTEVRDELAFSVVWRYGLTLSNPS
jgi:hypothetical protein